MHRPKMCKEYKELVKLTIGLAKKVYLVPLIERLHQELKRYTLFLHPEKMPPRKSGSITYFWYLDAVRSFCRHSMSRTSRLDIDCACLDHAHSDEGEDDTNDIKMLADPGMLSTVGTAEMVRGWLSIGGH